MHPPSGHCGPSGCVGPEGLLDGKLATVLSCHLRPASTDSRCFEPWGREGREKGVTQLADLAAQRLVFSEKSRVTDLHEMVHDHDLPESYSPP